MKVMRRPVIVDAIRVPNKILQSKEYFRWSQHQPEWYHGYDIWLREEGLVLPTIDGDMLCRWGDWIIRGQDGELYPCKNEIFNKIYMRIEDEKDAQLLSEEALKQ